MAEKRTVLLMDDEEMVCEIAERMITHLGYEAQVANDGLEAIELYKKRFNEGMAFDLVIMDLNVPNGFGGMETIKDILFVNPDAKVLVSSGYSADPVMCNPEEFGFAGSLSKPFEIKSFREMFKNFT